MNIYISRVVLVLILNSHTQSTTNTKLTQTYSFTLYTDSHTQLYFPFIHARGFQGYLTLKHSVLFFIRTHSKL